MQVLIVGATRLARALAEELRHSGHGVRLLEVGADPLEQTALGDAARGCDAVATVTDDDAANAVVALAARERLGVPLAVAVIADPARADALAGLGAHVVCPTKRTARELRRALVRSGIETELTLGRGFAVCRADVPARLAGRPLGDLADPGLVIPIAVERDGRVLIAAPGLTLAERDVLLAATADEDRLARLLQP